MGFAVAGFVLLIGMFIIATWVQIAKVENVDENALQALPTSGISGGIARLATPLLHTSSMQKSARSPLLNQLREKVLASGAYGGNFEAYLSMQIASMFVGTALFVLALSGEITGILKAGVVLAGIGITTWPYNTASKGAKEKAERSAAELPEFVEMLQIPLASGMSVEQALRFTCRFTAGPVRDEVQWLLDTLAARTMGDAEAFVEAGRRLGTAEAVAFFATLGQAHIEGTRVSGTLARQAESLRSQYHQLRRQRIKKLPVSMIIAFAIHFLPFLFALVLIPMVDSLKAIG